MGSLVAGALVTSKVSPSPAPGITTRLVLEEPPAPLAMLAIAVGTGVPTPALPNSLPSKAGRHLTSPDCALPALDYTPPAIETLPPTLSRTAPAGNTPPAVPATGAPDSGVTERPGTAPRAPVAPPAWWRAPRASLGPCSCAVPARNWDLELSLSVPASVPNNDKLGQNRRLFCRFVQFQN